MFYRIRYVFKNAGSQLIFWDNNSYVLEESAILSANFFLKSCQKETIADTSWFKEKDILKRKLVYTLTDDEETNFAVHVSIGNKDTVKFSAK